MARELNEILDELCDPAKAIPYMKRVNAAKQTLVNSMNDGWNSAWDRYNRSKNLAFRDIYTPMKPRWWQRLLKPSH